MLGLPCLVPLVTVDLLIVKTRYDMAMNGSIPHPHLFPTQPECELCPGSAPATDIKVYSKQTFYIHFTCNRFQFNICDCCFLNWICSIYGQFFIDHYIQTAHHYCQHSILIAEAGLPVEIFKEPILFLFIQGQQHLSSTARCDYCRAE